MPTNCRHLSFISYWSSIAFVFYLRLRSGFVIPVIAMLRKVSIIDANTAVAKLSITNPPTKKSTAFSMKPFSINVNMPSVIMFMGSVKTIKTGLISMFSTLSSNAADMAVAKPFTATPSNNHAMTYMEMELTIHLFKNFANSKTPFS